MGLLARILGREDWDWTIVGEEDLNENEAQHLPDKKPEELKDDERMSNLDKEEFRSSAGKWGAVVFLWVMGTSLFGLFVTLLIDLFYLATGRTDRASGGLQGEMHKLLFKLRKWNENSAATSYTDKKNSARRRSRI